MLITERELLLLVGIVSIIATYIITEWEFKQEEAELEDVKQKVLAKREFHSETFEEMKKDKVYKW